MFDGCDFRDVLIYGANGYTGRLTAHLAANLGLKPIIAGRNQEALEELSKLTGLPFRCYGLDELKSAPESLRGIKVVIHMAGPFSQTSRPLLNACIEGGVHYLDITGEIDVFEDIFQRANEVSQSSIVAIPGVGFDVVPTDCLAAKLKSKLPDANNLELAFHSTGSISRGTLKTILEKVAEECQVRRNGKISGLRQALQRKVDFGNGDINVVSISWGDVATAYRTTEIPNITVYTSMSRASGRIMNFLPHMKMILSSRLFIGSMQKLVDMTVDGPSSATLNSAKVRLWGRVSNASGESVELTSECVEGYRFTAVSALAAASRLLRGTIGTGVATPAVAFGAGFFDDVMSLARSIPVPSSMR